MLAQSRSDKAREIVGQYAKGGSNPDLQLRAVEYIGTFRSKDSQQLLSEVYSSVNDVNVKRAVLRSYMISHDTEHLFSAAKSETNPELRRDAIQWLGVMKAANELASMYTSEPDKTIKLQIINALFIGGAAKQLVDVARAEKDPELRKKAVEVLARMKSEGSHGLPDGAVEQMMRPAFLLFTSLLSAQPHLQNAQMQTRPVSGTLGATFRAMVTAQSGTGVDRVCCSPRSQADRIFDADTGCWLESRPATDRIPPGASNSVHLEGAPRIQYFLSRREPAG